MLLVCVCVCVSCLGARARPGTGGHRPSSCLTRSCRALVFVCLVGLPKAHFLICVFEPWRRPLRRTAKSTPGGASSQSWFPNSGQTSEGDHRSRALVLVSEKVQQLQLASSLSLLQEQSAQAGTQHQPVTSPLDQPIEGSVQYQQDGKDQTPLIAETSSQFQSLGSGTSGTTPAQYLPSGEGHVPNGIAEAQLTHPLIRQPHPSRTTPTPTHWWSMPQVGCQHTADDGKTKMRLLHHLWLAVCTR